MIQGERGRRQLCEYNLRSKQWIEWTWTPSLRLGPSVVCTKNGRYIISFASTFASIYPHEVSGRIIIYDLIEQQRIESPLRFPASRDVQAITVGDPQRDELVTFGFVNQTYKRPEFRHMKVPPRYLIQMIGKWHNSEYIHLMSVRGGKEQWRIPVAEILNSI